MIMKFAMGKSWSNMKTVIMVFYIKNNKKIEVVGCYYDGKEVLHTEFRNINTVEELYDILETMSGYLQYLERREKNEE